MAAKKFQFQGLRVMQLYLDVIRAGSRLASDPPPLEIKLEDSFAEFSKKHMFSNVVYNVWHHNLQ